MSVFSWRGAKHSPLGSGVGLPRRGETGGHQNCYQNDGFSMVRSTLLCVQNAAVKHRELDGRKWWFPGFVGQVVWSTLFCIHHIAAEAPGTRGENLAFSRFWRTNIFVNVQQWCEALSSVLGACDLRDCILWGEYGQKPGFWQASVSWYVFHEYFCSINILLRIGLK